MRLLARRARDELRAAGARPRRDARSGPAALTAAEHRVARFAADGHSNREIAEQLYVTQRTVETHLTHAFAEARHRRPRAAAGCARRGSRAAGLIASADALRGVCTAGSTAVTRRCTVERDAILG